MPELSRGDEGTVLSENLKNLGMFEPWWTQAGEDVTMGTTHPSRETITFEALGRKRVSVPAGIFEAIVIKKTNLKEGPHGDTRHNRKETEIIYAVEQVGMVRSELTRESSSPESARSSKHGKDNNAKIDAKLQQGIEGAMEQVHALEEKTGRPWYGRGG